MRGMLLPSVCHAARPCRAPFAAGAPKWRCTHSRCSARPARRRGAPPTAILQGLASTINTIMDGRPQKANKVVKRLFELLEAANLGAPVPGNVGVGTRSRQAVRCAQRTVPQCQRPLQLMLSGTRVSWAGPLVTQSPSLPSRASLLRGRRRTPLPRVSRTARSPGRARARSGVANTPEQRTAVLACVDELAALGAGEAYTREPTLCGNWQLAYTTEKVAPRACRECQYWRLPQAGQRWGGRQQCVRRVCLRGVTACRRSWPADQGQ